MDQYAKALQIKGMMQGQQLQNQQVQQGQMNLDDQRKVRQAFMDNNGDIDATIKQAAKSGVSPQMLTTLQQHSIDIKTKLASLTKDQLANFATTHDNAAGLIQPVLDAKTPEAKDAAYQQGLQAASQNPQMYGITDPSQLPPQRPNDDVLKTQLALHMGQKQQADQQLKASEGAKNTAQAAMDNANAMKANLENKFLQDNGGMTSGMAEAKYLALQTKAKQGIPIAPPDKAFMAAYEKNKTLVPTANFNLQNAGATGSGTQPSAIAKGIADGSIKWGDAVSARTPMQVKQALLAEVKQINPAFKSSDFEVEKKVQEAFTSGNYSQQLNSINRAREHMQTFLDAAKDLDGGKVQAFNKIGNMFSVQFGSDKVGNLQIAKQAFSSEVGKAFAGASVGITDREELNKAISNASSFSQLAGAARTADTLLSGAQKALKQTYESGQQGKPNFGNQPPASGGKTLTSAQIQQAAKDHGVSVDEATRQAKAAGYTIQ
jgi:hypothetical protein